MKKHIPSILAGICCVLVLICSMQIANLNQEIEALKNTVNSRFSMLESEVNSISYSVRDTLEEQASLVSSIDWYYGETDMEKMTVQVHMQIVPKSYTEGVTAASVFCGEKEYPMNLQDGVFNVQFPVSLLEESAVERVQFMEGETIATQQLSVGFSPRYDFLPIVYAQFAGSSTGSPEDGVYTKTYTGTLHIQVEQKGEGKPIESFSLVETLDGEEIFRQELELVDTLPSDPEAGVVYPEDMGNDDGFQQLFSELEGHKAQIPYGSRYSMYVEAVDGYGLHHVCLISVENINDKGEPSKEEDWEWRYGAEGFLYDAQGNPLNELTEEFGWSGRKNG